MSRAAGLAVLVCAATAHAGAWTRDAGHFYLNASWLHIDADAFHGSDGAVIPIRPYRQDVLGVFGEVGAISRWLTFTIDGTIYRRNELLQQGVVDGVGDWRIGAWTGLVTKPVRFSAGMTVGIPFGQAQPTAGPGADVGAQQIAASLPTGSGDANVEWRLALGYSFGRKPRWPVGHYVLAEAGYWLRTNGISDSFVYRVELGTRFPWKFVDRFWVTVRITGLQSFSTEVSTASNTGLGTGVSYVAPGVEVYGRIWRGLGLAVAVDTAVYATSLPAGVQTKLSLSYQY
jgi:hypothetical protein